MDNIPSFSKKFLDLETKGYIRKTLERKIIIIVSDKI